MQFGVGVMDVYETRKELRRMGRRDLLKLVSAQRTSRCLIGGRPCGLYMHYKGLNFCLRNNRRSCQLKSIKKLGYRYEGVEEIDSPLPLVERPRYGSFAKRREGMSYY